MNDPAMRHGPDIARLAALVGDPARANMLTALMDGRALTAGELAREAGVTAQTASAHLARMEEAGLLLRRAQGRHRYFALASPDVAAVLEGLMGLAARAGHRRTRPGPRDASMREARVCYDHLAGAQAVAMLDGLVERGAIAANGRDLVLTDDGAVLFERFGVDVAALRRARRPLSRACLDWSERRVHLGGGLGAAILARLLERGWARREPGSRAVRFTNSGMVRFRETLTGPG